MNLSIVMAVWNEHENLAPVLSEVQSALSALPSLSSHEIVVVDDGSTDGTREALDALASPTVRPIHLDRHRGKTAALHAGFAAARHEIIATLDGDGQDVPGEIAPLLARVVGGDAFAIGVRRNRRDTLRKSLSSRIANAVRRAVLGDPFEDIGCGLRVFVRACVADFAAWEGAHRFFPYFAWRAGRRVATEPVLHRPRLHGRSKYGILDRLLVGTVTLGRIVGSGILAGTPPPPFRPAVIASVAGGAFAAAGILANGDWGETRDGPSTLNRAVSNLQILDSVFHHQAVPASAMSWIMHHPALPATLAFLSAKAEFPFFPHTSDVARLNFPFFLWACAGLYFLYRFVREYFDEATAAIAVLFMTTFPRFLAGAHMYHKDLPLMVGGVLCLWSSAAAARRPGHASAAVAGAATGLAISFHLFGTIFVPVFFAAQIAGGAGWRALRHGATFLVVAVAVVFALNPILWQDPAFLTHSAEIWMGNFWPFGENYFGGHAGGHFPWHYIWVHFFFATPLFQTACFLAGLYAMCRSLTPAAVAVASLFALTMTIESVPSVIRYDGIRHIFLVLPAFAIIGAAGLVALYRAASAIGRGALLLTTIVLGVALPVAAMVVLHPFEEGYVNGLGLLLSHGEPGQYVYLFDYDSPMHETVGWLNRNAAPGATVWLRNPELTWIYPLRPDLVLKDENAARYRIVSGPSAADGCREIFSIERYGMSLAAIDDCRARQPDGIGKGPLPADLEEPPTYLN